MSTTRKMVYTRVILMVDHGGGDAGPDEIDTVYLDTTDCSLEEAARKRYGWRFYKAEVLGNPEYC